VPPLAVLASAAIVLVTSIFSHGNVTVPEAVDRVLRRLLVTPDMHRVHHSALQWEGNSNFGAVFPWWDRVFGTYRSAPMVDRRRMALGLAEARSPEDVTLTKLLLLTVPAVASSDGTERAGPSVT
jgi:sterol desaturase/sphingolipid hydroxylase (fatty acid hydroxylase superfamily)